MKNYGIVYTDALGIECQLIEYWGNRLRAYPTGEGYRWLHFRTQADAEKARDEITAWEHPDITNVRVVAIPAEHVDGFHVYCA